MASPLESAGGEYPRLAGPLTEGEAIDAIFCILDDFDPPAQWRILVHQRLRHLHDYKDFPERSLEEV